MISREENYGEYLQQLAEERYGRGETEPEPFGANSDDIATGAIFKMLHTTLRDEARVGADTEPKLMLHRMRSIGLMLIMKHFLDVEDRLFQDEPINAEYLDKMAVVRKAIEEAKKELPGVGMLVDLEAFKEALKLAPPAHETNAAQDRLVIHSLNIFRCMRDAFAYPMATTFAYYALRTNAPVPMFEGMVSGWMDEFKQDVMHLVASMMLPAEVTREREEEDGPDWKGNDSGQ